MIDKGRMGKTILGEIRQKRSAGAGSGPTFSGKEHPVSRARLAIQPLDYSHSERTSQGFSDLAYALSAYLVKHLRLSETQRGFVAQAKPAGMTLPPRPPKLTFIYRHLRYDGSVRARFQTTQSRSFRVKL